jgi:hypothetical protein
LVCVVLGSQSPECYNEQSIRCEYVHVVLGSQSPECYN